MEMVRWMAGLDAAEVGEGDQAVEMVGHTGGARDVGQGGQNRKNWFQGEQCHIKK